MNHTLEVVGNIVINTHVKNVWSTMTEPSYIAQYLYGAETITNWKEGSDIVFQGEYQGQTYKDKGIVVTNIPNKQLSYRYWSGFSGLADELDNYCLIDLTLESIDDQRTMFQWKQKGFSSIANKEHSEQGMEALLSQIKTIAESI